MKLKVNESPAILSRKLIAEELHVEGISANTFGFLQPLPLVTILGSSTVIETLTRPCWAGSLADGNVWVYLARPALFVEVGDATTIVDPELTSTSELDVAIAGSVEMLVGMVEVTVWIGGEELVRGFGLGLGLELER